MVDFTIAGPGFHVDSRPWRVPVMLLHVRLMSEALALIRLRLLWLAAELTAAILLRWRGLAAKLAAVIRLRLLRWLPAEMMAIDGRRRLPLGRRGLVLVYLR